MCRLAHLAGILLLALLALILSLGGILVIVLVIAHGRKKAIPLAPPDAPPQSSPQAAVPEVGVAVEPPASRAPQADPVGVVARAWVSDDAPAQRAELTVYGQLSVDGVGVAGLPMRAVWRYASSAPVCEGITDDQGIASCVRNVGGAAKGRPVEVEVQFVHEGKTRQALASFTPQ